LKITPWFYG